MLFRKIGYFSIVSCLSVCVFANIGQQWVDASNSKPSMAHSLDMHAQSAHVANPVVLSWFNEAVISAFSLDFANHVSMREYAATYFTPAGWQSMDKRHTEMRDVDIVIQNKMVESSVALAPPKMISQGAKDGGYSWLVEAPFLVVIADKTHRSERRLLLRGLVVRADANVHPRGLAIEQIAIKYLPATKTEKARVSNG